MSLIELLVRQFITYSFIECIETRLNECHLYQINLQYYYK